MNKYDVCIISKGAGDILLNTKSSYYLGPDIKSATVALEIAKNGFNVLLLTKTSHNNQIEFSEKLKIINVDFWDNSNTINFKRFFQFIVFWKRLSRLNVRVFFQHGSLPGIIGLYCKLNNKKFILDIASDSQMFLTPHKKNFNMDFFSGIIFYVGNLLDLLSASHIITQHEDQFTKMNTIDKKITIIKPVLASINKIDSTNKKGDLIAWIGSIAKVKRPEFFLDIAEAIPNEKFILIGGHHGDIQLYEKIKERAQHIPNVTLTGPLSHDLVLKYFNNIKLLVNTSSYEGFPNTFIEAWAHSIPVLTLGVDPASTIVKNKLGNVFSNVADLIEFVNGLDDIEYQKMSFNIEIYYNKYHNYKNYDKYADILK